VSSSGLLHPIAQRSARPRLFPQFLRLCTILQHPALAYSRGRARLPPRSRLPSRRELLLLGRCLLLSGGRSLLPQDAVAAFSREIRPALLPPRRVRAPPLGPPRPPPPPPVRGGLLPRDPAAAAAAAATASSPAGVTSSSLAARSSSSCCSGPPRELPRAGRAPPALTCQPPPGWVPSSPLPSLTSVSLRPSIPPSL
jgi:hypothetical protein